MCVFFFDIKKKKKKKHDVFLFLFIQRKMDMLYCVLLMKTGVDGHIFSDTPGNYARAFLYTSTQRKSTHFASQYSSCHLYKITTFHLTLTNCTISGKTSGTNFLLIHRRKDLFFCCCWSFQQPNGHTRSNLLQHKIDFTCDVHVVLPPLCIS